MKKINYEKLNTFVATDVIKPFYEIRLERLESAKLADISKRKNPYLFKAKNIETAGDLAKGLLDAFLSSQEETIFGDLMEKLAIHICQQVFNGSKAEQGKYRSVDLIFEKGSKTFIVGIKSGPNWGNSDQVNIMKRNFKKAKAQLKRDQIVRQNKEFAFTKLFTCGYCGSTICAEEKWKVLKDGTSAHYIYYGCGRAKDRNCKNKYIREEELIDELLKIIDVININELGMRTKLED